MLSKRQIGWEKRKKNGLGGAWNKGKRYKTDKASGEWFNCLICNNRFYRYPAYIKLGNTKYCSNKCFGMSRIGTENFSNPDKGHTVIYNCEECSKETKVKLAIYNKAVHHFCSSSCSNTYKGRNTSGLNHPMWKGGITKPSHSARTNASYRKWQKQVFERDNRTCTKCGVTDKLEAHHIKSFRDYPLERYEVYNGITVCKSCHIRIDNDIKNN